MNNDIVKNKKLTIVTPIRNSRECILDLIRSLNNQIDNNFYWLIINGNSTDNSIDVIKENTIVEHRIITGEDFSIYHALNIAIKFIDTSYYCVVGSDDVIENNFVHEANLILKDENLDLIFGAVTMEDKFILPGNNCGWLYGMHGVGSSHSVGTIIKKDLHKIYGLYSKEYPVVADQFFIKKCVKGGAYCLRTSRLFGNYSLSGYSASNKLNYQLDYFKMQINTGEFFALQFIIFIIRIFKLLLLKKINSNNK